jgi:acyl-CoA dehydrogenase
MRTHEGTSLPDTDFESLIQRIREFITEEAYDLEPNFLTVPFRELLPTLQEKRDQVKQLGLWAPAMPRDLGGLGLNLLQFARVSEELGRTPLGHYLFNCQAPDIGNMELLIGHGSPRQKEVFLKPLVDGEIRSCFAMTEPDFPGSNPSWMSARAVRDGNEYVINAHKWFTSSAEGSAFSIVMAVTNPDAQDPYKRASMFLVPNQTRGFERIRNIQVMGDEGSDYVSHAEVRYSDCRVPVKNRIGEEGEGFRLAQERLGPGRIHHCMRWIGICERAFELMCRRAAEREIAPGVRLGSRHDVQHRIAESRAEINASRLLVLDAAERIDRDGAHAARESISIIKFYVAGILQRVLDRAIQVHGALGMTDDTILAYWYRHERAARIYDGPDEVHKTVVARNALGHYGLKVQPA